MTSVIFFAITASIFVCGQSAENDLITITLKPNVFFNTESYTDKICKSEPTCNLINDATPREYTTLDRRNCMCDSDCSRYGDCCLDSKYYNITEQKRNFRNFHCSFQESIYMITSCPRSYSDNATRSKCEKSTLPLDEDDVTLIIPVTNVDTRVTYGNKYCARCHGAGQDPETEKNYRLWNETRYCSVKQTESIRPPGPDDFQQHYPVANLDNDTSSSSGSLDGKLPQFYRLENSSTDLTENDDPWLLPHATSTSNDLADESVRATKYIKFNSTSKTFYSIYNNKNFVCSVGRDIPKDLESNVRRCVRFSTMECADVSNKTLTDKCQSYTSVVYDNYGSYRNKDCAACNNVTKNLPGCFSQSKASTQAAASNLFSTNDKVTSGLDPCKDSALKNKFCK